MKCLPLLPLLALFSLFLASSSSPVVDDLEDVIFQKKAFEQMKRRQQNKTFTSNITSFLNLDSMIVEYG